MPDEKKNERLLLTAVFLFWFSNYTYPSFLTTYATNTLGATKVLAGMIVGAVTVVIWKSVGLGDTLYEIVPGFILNVVTILIVNLFTKPEPEVVAEFDEMVETIKART